MGLLGLRDEMRRSGPGTHGIALATAHPAKFAETVEPLIGQELPIPPGIARVMDRPRCSVTLDAELGGPTRGARLNTSAGCAGAGHVMDRLEVPKSLFQCKRQLS